MENKRYKKEQDIHLTKEEYLAQLKKYLKRLPKEDYNNAMDYFTEYFEDAGAEGEAALIQDLEDYFSYISFHLCRSYRRCFGTYYNCSCFGRCFSNCCRTFSDFLFWNCICPRWWKTFYPRNNCHHCIAFRCEPDFWCRII